MKEVYISRTASAIDTATTGDKLSYTCPMGCTAEIAGSSYYSRTGIVTPPTIALRCTKVDGSILNYLSIASGLTQNDSGRKFIDEGDTVAWNVSVGGVASTSDFTLSIIARAKEWR